MPKKPMSTPSDPLTAALDLLKGIGTLRTRKMFGGTYIYCDDLFIATVHDETLYFKANASTAGEFTKRGLRQFSYSREGEIATLQYYEAPAEVFNDRALMARWAKLALKAAKQDAAKKSRKE
ncbi:MAG: TfoX/Sxy family protein [Burkholderiaceae bacterium]